MVRSSLARPCSVVKHCMPEHFENSKLSKRALIYVCVMMTHGNQERYVLSYLEYITWLGATHADGAYKRHRQTIKLALRLKTWHCMLAVSLKCMTLCTCTACCLTLDLYVIHTDRHAGTGTQALHQAACDTRTRAWFWSGALTCQNVNAISLAICAPECYLRAIPGPVVDAFYSWVPFHNLVVVIPSMMRDLSETNGG